MVDERGSTGAVLCQSWGVEFVPFDDGLMGRSAKGKEEGMCVALGVGMVSKVQHAYSGVSQSGRTTLH